jgi:ribosomal protein S16
MLKIKTNKKKLNYKLIIIAKKKTTRSGKTFKNLANFDSKIIQLDINLYVFWLNQNVHLTNKTKQLINSNQIPSKNYVKFMYTLKNNEKI